MYVHPGVFMAFMDVPANTHLAGYFMKYRSLALGLATSFTALMHVGGPPAIIMLVEEYGWRNANLVCAAICIQVRTPSHCSWVAWYIESIPKGFLVENFVSYPLALINRNHYSCPSPSPSSCPSPSPSPSSCPSSSPRFCPHVVGLRILYGSPAAQACKISVSCQPAGMRGAPWGSTSSERGLFIY